jgi:uncharacterized membrane protein
VNPRIGSGIGLFLLAAGATAALVTGLPEDLRAIFVFPLVFLLPGLALGQALLPARTAWEERLLLCVALSMAIAILGAVALHWMPLRLDAATWTGILVCATVVVSGATRAWAPRRPPERLPRSWRRLRAKTVALIILALVITSAAFALARTPLPAQHIEGYSALWIVPPRTGSDTLRIGVTNAELGSVAYTLKVKESGQVAVQRRFELAPGQRWQADVLLTTAASQGEFQATLYRGASKAPYRRVNFVLPVPSASSSELPSS